MLDDKGGQIAVMSRSQALEYAKEHELDLVLIGAKAVPPVIKAIDYSKFLYQESKREQEAKKSQHKSDTKDIQLSIFIGENDIEVRRKRAFAFLADGHQLRIKLLLKGREMMRQDRAKELVYSFIKSLGDEAKIAREPTMQGRTLVAIVIRNKK